jgi:hypothetical protein
LTQKARLQASCGLRQAFQNVSTPAVDCDPGSACARSRPLIATNNHQRGTETRSGDCCCSHSDLSYEHSLETCMRKFAIPNNNLLTPGNPNEIYFSNHFHSPPLDNISSMYASQHLHLCVPNTAHRPGKATRLPVLCISPPRREPLTDWPVFQAHDKFLRSAYVSSALQPHGLETFSTGLRVSRTRVESVPEKLIAR